jgi:hypothetical protein
MVWRDPIKDPAAPAVLAAFEAARRDELPQVDCYRAGSAAQIRGAKGGRCDPRGQGQAARRRCVMAARA